MSETTLYYNGKNPYIVPGTRGVLENGDTITLDDKKWKEIRETPAFDAALDLLFTKAPESKEVEKPTEKAPVQKEAKTNRTTKKADKEK